MSYSPRYTPSYPPPAIRVLIYHNSFTFSYLSAYLFVLVALLLLRLRIRFDYDANSPIFFYLVMFCCFASNIAMHGIYGSDIIDQNLFGMNERPCMC